MLVALAIALSAAPRQDAEAVVLQLRAKRAPESAAGVLHRLLGRRADAFKFALIPARGGHDVFDYQASDGVVRVEGDSAVAMCRGAYTYLRDVCRCVVTWDGDQLDLPKTLPDAPLTSVECMNPYRHYFNVCTFGYTTAFWDWKRWQREIDWMALHGINMPLAMVGQERVWEEVWESYGLPEDRIRAFFTGPAFLPWHRMGNLNNHAGPLPQDWLDRQSDLQKQILDRERELGMTPVVPGFSGFVPPEFAETFPRARVLDSSGWAGFPPTHQLDARDPMFPAIQKRFIDAYTKTYGTDHLYLCDLYNEMSPTVSADRRDQDLAETGAAIWKGIVDADPDATWVMQGWLFHNDPGYWKEPEIAAFLGGVPDDRMVLLDLACEESEMWRASAAFRKKRYVWNLLHGFGGRTRLFGDLALEATKPIAALDDPDHGNWAGMGLTMEGIDENAIVYELMCDMMWRTTPVDPAAWTVDYLARRYDCAPEVAKPMADALRETFYAHGASVWDLMPYQERPSKGAIPKPDPDLAKYRAVVETFLNAPASVQTTPLFRRDLVDVTKRVAAGEIALAMADAVSPDPAAASAGRARFDALMVDLDALLHTVPQYRLSDWIHAARACSGDGDELERNARLQVTVWGGPELNDYAAKEWSGLVRDFYKPRWDRFFDALAKPGFADAAWAADSAKWESDWCDKTGLTKVANVDPIAEAKKLLAE